MERGVVAPRLAAAKPTSTASACPGKTRLDPRIGARYTQVVGSFLSGVGLFAAAAEEIVETSSIMFANTRSRRARAVAAGVVVLLVLGAVGVATTSTRPSREVARPQTTLYVCPYPDLWSLWNFGAAVRIRADVARMRACGITEDDVLKALGESGMVGAAKRPDPPPGVVFVARLGRPEQYENIILRASADGEILRLRDVAEVDAGGWAPAFLRRLCGFE